jgi:hypothetical protein
MKFIIIKPDITTNEFLELLTEQFPAIKEEIWDEDWKDLIHLQVACFSRYTNQCIMSGRLDEVRRCFDFFEKTIDKVDAITENALYVSYLEHIDMAGNERHKMDSRKLLNKKYLDIWEQLQQ